MSSKASTAVDEGCVALAHMTTLFSVSAGGGEAAGVGAGVETVSAESEAVTNPSRRRVPPDGSVVKLGPTSPTDTCRISHLSVCPGRG
jgi:hypothetical protein